MKHQSFKDTIKERFLSGNQPTEGEQIALLRYCQEKGIKHLKAMKQALHELIKEHGFILDHCELSPMQKALMEQWQTTQDINEHEAILQEYRAKGLGKYDHLPIIKALNNGI
jgi:hypothetical protein